MPNYTFLTHFKPQISKAQKFKLNIHLTNPPNSDHIYKLRFYMPEEHIC